MPKLSVILLAICAALMAWATFDHSRRKPEQPHEPIAQSVLPNDTAAPLPAPSRSGAFDSQPNQLTESVAQAAWRNPQNWTDAVVLAEQSDEPYSAIEGAYLRRRIVESSGFDFPVHLVEAVVDGESQLLDSFAANQIILHSDAHFPEQIIEQAEALLGWRRAHVTNSPHIVALEAPNYDFNSVSEALALIEKSGLPVLAGANHIYYASALPNDPRFSVTTQWALHDPVYDHDIDAPLGWEIRSTAENIVLAVIDSGMNLSHEDLKANLWTNPNEIPGNGIDDDRNGFIDDIHGASTVAGETTPGDQYGHGTHVAGIAGAVGNNGKGIAGVAWRVKLMPVKFLNSDGRGTTADAIAAIDYALAEGADIINASWGGYIFDAALEKAVSRANLAQVLIIAAAGNNSGSQITYPARFNADNIVSVGSSNRSGEKSLFSNYSFRDVDVFAPGDHVLSTWHESDSAYTSLNGTSMAASFVSGILALNFAHFPDDDYLTQKKRLIMSAKKRDAFKQRSVSGGIASLAASLALEHVPFPPEIISSSDVELALFEGRQAAFTVEASSRLPVFYQWYFRGTPLPNENGPSLTFNAANPAQEGNYRLDVINDDGVAQAFFTLQVYPRRHDIEAISDSGLTIFSKKAAHWKLIEHEGETTIINGPLEAEEQAELFIYGPPSALFRIAAKTQGEDSPQFQTKLTGPLDRVSSFRETWSTIDLRSDSKEELFVHLTHQRRYARDSSGEATLILTPPKVFAEGALPPIINHHPSSRTLRPGDRWRLRVYTEDDRQALVYAWFKDGVRLPAVDEAFLDIVVTSESSAGEYYVIVSNPFGSTRSNTAVLAFNSSPQSAFARLLPNTENLDVGAGQPLHLSMDIYGTNPITYQWYKDKVLIPGATSPTLFFPSAKVAHTGKYELHLSNEYNHSVFVSPGITATVHEQYSAPRFAAEDKQSQEFIIERGKRFSHSLVPYGSMPMEFSWFKDDVGLNSQDPSQGYLRFDKIDLSDSGTYYLEAHNSLGVDQSGRIHISVTDTIAEALELDSDAIYSLHGSIAKSPNSRYYIISQTQETWDGEDAVEFYIKGSESNHQLRLTIAQRAEPRALRLHWKIESSGLAARFGYGERGQLKPSVDGGGWQTEVVTVEPGKRLSLVLDAQGEEVRAWLDQIELVETPVLHQDLTFSYPVENEPVSLQATFYGPDLRYQWYRDDQAIMAATESTLEIARFSAADAGAYHLVASNAAGEARTSVVELEIHDSISRIVSDHIELAFTDPSRISTLRQHPDHEGRTLSVVTTNSDTFGFETRVTGPAVFVMDYHIGPSETTITINGVIHPVPTERQRNRFGVFVPAGTHLLKFYSDPHVTPHTFELYQIYLSKEPFAMLNTSPNEQYREYKLPLAHFSGQPPLTLKWFRDGALIDALDDLSEGSAFPYDRPSVALDRGDYHFIVTDALGREAVSNSIRLDLPHRANEVLDYDGSIDHFPEQSVFAFDLTEYQIGDASLRIDGPFDQSENTHSFHLRANEATFYIKASGFAPGATLAIVSADQRVEAPLDGNWRKVVASFDNQRLDLLLPQAVSANAHLWIDGLSTRRAPRFVTQPKNIATFLGARVAFEAQLYANDRYHRVHWRRNGVPIANDHESTLRIDRVAPSDFGIYEAFARLEDGTEFSSKPAKLSPISSAFGAAIGYPSARITTTGDSLWSINRENSLEGPTSLRSGPLDKVGESSSISIELDGPGSFGIYVHGTRLYGDRSTNWTYMAGPTIAAGESNQIEYTISRRSYDSPDEEVFALIDSLRVARFSTVHYQDWLNRKTAAISETYSESDTAANADPDGDGIPNWMEFALNLDPFAPSKLPSLGISVPDSETGVASISFYSTRNDEYSVSYEVSNDLVEWHLIKPSSEIVHSNAEYDFINARFQFPASDGKPYFVRWSVHHLVEADPHTLGVQK